MLRVPPQGSQIRNKRCVNFRPILARKINSAQIIQQYDPNTLPEREVTSVVNFPPRQIEKIMTEVSLLGFPNRKEEVILIRPDYPVINGGNLC
jgi:tRNA-binding protein